MLLGCMDIALREQAHEVQCSPGRLDMGDGFLESRVCVEFLVFNGEIDARQTLVKNAARADREVTDLGITHFPPRKAHGATGTVHRHGWIAFYEPFKHRHVGIVNRIAIGLWGYSEAIDDNQDNRFRSRHSRYFSHFSGFSANMSIKVDILANLWYFSMFPGRPSDRVATSRYNDFGSSKTRERAGEDR